MQLLDHVGSVDQGSRNMEEYLWKISCLLGYFEPMEAYPRAERRKHEHVSRMGLSKVSCKVVNDSNLNLR